MNSILSQETSQPQNVVKDINQPADESLKEIDQYAPQYWQSQFPSYSFKNLLVETQNSLIWIGTNRTASEHLVLKISPIFQNNGSVQMHRQSELAFLTNVQLSRMPKVQILIKSSTKIENSKQFRVISMEYFERGNLQKYWKYFSNSKRKNTRQHLIFVIHTFKQMLIAVKQMHSVRYVHRDLKLQNFLFDKSYKVYLSDFQLVIKQMQFDSSLCGTLQFIAPERLSKNRGQQPVQASSDVWSLGIILYEMLTGQIPFSGENPEQILQEICQGLPLYRSQTSKEAINLIHSILEINPSKRPSIQKIQSHPFLNKDIKIDEIVSILNDIS